MTFDDYQKISRTTAIYPNVGQNFIYPTLGLTGEAGEVAEKIKKVIRDNNGVMDDAARQSINKELGDVLWYVAQLATELNLTLDAIAASNIEKINSRKQRDAIHGNGDTR